MHIPVLKDEVLEYLDPRENENFIDCTAGEGGHTFAILERTAPNGKVLAIDKDIRNIGLIKARANEEGLNNRIITQEGNYADIDKIVKKEGFNNVSGFLFDLGLSSWHIDESGRGFSFRRDEPLDMRYHSGDGVTAWEIVNSWPPKEIELILREFGEERFAKRITEAIISRRKVRKIDISSDLAGVISDNIPKTKRIHPATQTFQALRMVVNNELENIGKALPLALENLERDGRMAIISFHSLEDRLIKRFFREMAAEGRVRILTKRPVVPSEEEIKNNSRSRTAKLRVLIKIR